MRETREQIALDAAEQALLRAHIAARGARAVAKAVGISVDATTLAACGGRPRSGTCIALRSWLAGVAP